MKLRQFIAAFLVAVLSVPTSIPASAASPAGMDLQRLGVASYDYRIGADGISLTLYDSNKGYFGTVDLKAVPIDNSSIHHSISLRSGETASLVMTINKTASAVTYTAMASNGKSMRVALDLGKTGKNGAVQVTNVRLPEGAEAVPALDKAQIGRVVAERENEVFDTPALKVLRASLIVFNNRVESEKKATVQKNSDAYCPVDCVRLITLIPIFNCWASDSSCPCNEANGQWYIGSCMYAILCWMSCGAFFCGGEPCG